MTLPLEIEQSFKSQSESGTICASCRALNSLDGGLGETHVITDEDNLYLFSRRVGEGIEEMNLPAASINALTVVEDRPFAYLKISCGEGEFSLKFSAMDKEVLEAIAGVKTAGDVPAAEATASTADAKPTPPPVPTADPGPDPYFEPLVGFCAAVYALIQVDGNIDPEELILLNRQVGNPEKVAKGLEYLRRIGTVGLIERLNREFDHNQKLCLIANMLEISMVDGLLRSTEKGLLKQFREALGMSAEDYEAIFEIILVKNNLSVFQPK